MRKSAGHHSMLLTTGPWAQTVLKETKHPQRLSCSTTVYKIIKMMPRQSKQLRNTHQHVFFHFYSICKSLSFLRASFDMYVSECVRVYHGLLVWYTPLRVLSFTALPVSLFPVYQSFVSEKCDGEWDGDWSLDVLICEQAAKKMMTRLLQNNHSEVLRQHAFTCKAILC